MGGTPKTPEMIKHMLDALDSPRQFLTKWEEGFLISVNDQFSRTGTLSDLQFEKLESIYTEKTD